MEIKERIAAFVNLGQRMKTFSESDTSDLFERAGQANPWFNADNVSYAFAAIAEWLQEETLASFCNAYPGIQDKESGKTVGVVMPGNIPLAGFHDFLCVLLTGHKIRAKCAETDHVLLPAIAQFLIEADDNFKPLISFGGFKTADVDRVIATGGNNARRYFEYYFSAIPHVIRGHRNSIAVLQGDESDDDLQHLGEDIFRYFGLGCRSVSKIFIPHGFDFDRLFRALYPWKHFINHNRYANNYEYYRSIYLLDRIPVLDNNFIILKEDMGMASPPGVLYYTFYGTLDEVKNRIRLEKDGIQCATGHGYLPFGMAQHPKITDFADDIDTMDFLIQPCNVDNLQAKKRGFKKSL